ncbi:uncharacterized protein N0V89_004320 [Didymosphaeria variabile]|uniref:Uncharacterized protein n=1 Tax=Didymosphaeria variabile TaxID=1932322 RepID=A0A9W9CCA9_9PLEO|nr:uncharacterized protein N0V89_004320 [Didymosphaeria variabile]KAJ4356289.1 hypothetical protein N0V89_004320 [Didymosphaeria variabile]
MSVYTCYTDPATCLMVSIAAGTPGADAPETIGFFTTSASGGESKPRTTRTSRTEDDDGKPSQTDDKTQPDATQPVESGRSSTRHTFAIVTATSEPTTESTSTRETNTDAAKAVPSLAAGYADGNGGSGGGGVSPGAVAGIAIATAIVGAAIAFFAAFMLFKRRRPSKHGHSESSTNFITKGDQPSYVQVSQVGPPPILAAAMPTLKHSIDLSDLSHSSDFLAGVLPPAADEQTVQNKVTALFDQTLQHVNAFYRDVHATLTPTMQNDLKKFGDSSMNLAEELEHSSFPTTAIKHALVGYILHIVAPEAEHQSTLFPAEVAGLRQNERSFESPDDQAAYILYKRLAAHLHAPPTSSLQSRQSDIREAAEHFALTFFPWANPAYADQDKDENLVDVINNALDLSLWLFGQPYLYEWVWEEVGRRGTVVSPGMVRVTDERGRMLDRPSRVVDAAISAG